MDNHPSTSQNNQRPERDFVLASGSRYKYDLLTAAGIQPAQMDTPDSDETPLKNELPAAYVKRVARLKALKTAEKYPNRCIIAADTVIAVGRRIIRKAPNETMARHHLDLLSGRRHRVISGLCIITPAGKVITRTVISAVVIKHLSPADINRIVASGEWRDVSGYKIEGILSGYVTKIIGSYPNILGMPVYDVVQILNGLPH